MIREEMEERTSRRGMLEGRRRRRRRRRSPLYRLSTASEAAEAKDVEEEMSRET